MGSSPTPEDPAALDGMRAGLRGIWDGAAGAWNEHAAFVDHRGEVVTRHMLDGVAVAPGDRVLELACGPGGVGLAASERVGPGGEVVLSDVSAGMTEFAARRAEELGLENVTARVLDLERIDEPDEGFDVVVCREGLMLVPEPERAASEIHRVLRPGGRSAIAVWGPRERNPWLGVLLDAASAQLGVPIPPPGFPGPFSLDDAGRLGAILGDAGLSDVAVEELPTPHNVESFDEYWSVVPSLAGPLGPLLAAQPEEAREAIRESAREALAPHATADGLELPGLTLVAVAHRAK